jgi:hypothetical protein
MTWWDNAKPAGHYFRGLLSPRQRDKQHGLKSLWKFAWKGNHMTSLKRVEVYAKMRAVSLKNRLQIRKTANFPSVL